MVQAGEQRPVSTRAPSQAEIPSLTSLRGVLAVWVVLFHFWNDILVMFPWVSPLSPVARRGDFAVPAFFVLSGFLLARRYGPEFRHAANRSIPRFLARRLTRIYPVHVVTLAWVLVMVVAARRLGYGLSDSGYSGREFLMNLFLVHAWTPHLVLSWNYPSWSISSEWFVYLLFPFLVRHLSLATGTPVRARSSFGVCAGLSVAVLLFWENLPFREMVVVVPTFVAGMLAYGLIQEAGETKPAPAPVVPLALAAVVLLACYLPGRSGLAILLFALLTLVPALARRPGSRRLQRTFGLLLLGEVSYSLYMTHTLAQKILYRALPSAHFSGASLGVRVGVLGCYAALVLALCGMTYVFVERPGRQWGRRWTARPGKSSGWAPTEMPG